MLISTSQIEPTTTADDFAGPVPIQIRKDFRQREQIMSWPGFVKLMSKPTWLGEQSLAEFVRASESASDEFADLLAKLDGLPPPMAPESLKAGEWRPMPWSASRGQHDPEHGRYSVFAIDVPQGYSLEQVVDGVSYLRAIIHSRYAHSPDQPLWRVIVAADPPLTDEQVQTLRRTFSRFILGDHSGRKPDGDGLFSPWPWFRLPACPRECESFYTAVHIRGRPVGAEGWLRGSTKTASVEQLAAPNGDSRDVAITCATPEPICIHAATRCANSNKPERSAPHAPMLPTPNDERVATEEPTLIAPPIGVDPRAELFALVKEFKASGDYASIRSRYLAMSLHLNEKGVWAPGFRPTPKVPKAAKLRRPEHMEIHRDQIVIDCHWLRCTGSPVYPRDKDYSVLFDPKTEFDMALAQSFASQKWSKQHRVDDALSLTDFQQAQLATLQSTDVMTRRRHALHGTGVGTGRISARMSKFQMSMNRWCERDPRMREHRDMYEALWLARELLGDDARADHLAQLAALKIGSGAAPLTAGTVREKLRKLDRQLGTLGGA